MNYEQESYEVDDLWGEDNISQADIERINYLSKMIPDDVKSILDAGCGGGVFINQIGSLRPIERLCGMDRSIAALKQVKTEKKLGSIDQIPFKDNEFDMVTCLEVLEHLPLSKYENALKEITRVSRKYIMVSVPNKQNLRDLLVSCPSCYTKFNPDYHMRCFDYSSVYNLLNAHNSSCIGVYHISAIDYYFGSRYMQLFRKKKEGPFPWFAICPVCGCRGNLKIDASKKNQVVCEGKFKSLIKSFWPKKNNYRWLAGLYIKKNKPVRS